MSEVSQRKLYRDSKNGKIFGVCAGLAEYLDVDVTIVRLFMALFGLAGGTGVGIYLVAAVIMPDKKNLDLDPKV